MQNKLPVVLGKSSLFQGLSNAEILAFIQNCPCRIASYSKNDCIITKDGTSHFIGIILEGTVGVYTDSYFGGHTLIGIGDTDYLFGFIAMFFNEKKSITALYCRTRCKVAYFKVKDVSNPVQFVQEINPRILVNIYAMLAKHIRDDFSRAHIISTPSVSVKLVRYLLERHIATNSLAFDLVFRRSELANFLGVFRTSLSRAIKQLRETQVIAINGPVVRILKLESLIAIERGSYG